MIEVVDLFCGVGGLTHGIKKSGVRVVGGFDIDASCKYAYEHNNHSHFYEENIKNITGQQINALYSCNSIRALVGCAPCQPFSNMAKKYNKTAKNDEKWNLLTEFGRIISEVNPEIVSMENVPQIQKTDVFKKFLLTLRRNGYYYDFKTVYCPAYGIPQNRKRTILLASTLGKICILPETHSKSNFVTVKDCIYELPKIDAGEICKTDVLHRAASLNELNLKRIRSSIPGGTWKDWDMKLRANCHKKLSGLTFTSVYARMKWDSVSPTITTQFYSYGTGRYGHPEQDRALTLREGALLQTFPFSYEFIPKGRNFSFQTLARQIGNAVPVKLGEIIGLSIKQHVKEIENVKKYKKQQI